MDKLHEIIKRWMLIEDQLRGLEYHMLNEQPVDNADITYAQKFASVRSQLATLRVKYAEEKEASSHCNANQQPEQNNYDLGAPRFAYDEFPVK